MPKAIKVVAGTGGAAPENLGKVLVHQDLDLLTTGAMTQAKLRQIFGDPTLGWNNDPTNLSIVDDGTRHVMRMTVDALWSGTRRIAYQPFLPESMDDGYIEFNVRFNTDLEYGQGGKFLGLGGEKDNGSMPSGGTHKTTGFSVRNHWGPQNSRDDRWHAYCYFPKDQTTWGTTRHPNNPTSGDAVELGATGTYPNQFASGEEHKIKLRVKHNTVVTEGSTSQPADGFIQMYQDDVCIRDGKPAADLGSGEVTRLYQAANSRRIALSIFRGGSDPNWNVTNHGTIDFWDIRVVKLA